MPVAAGPEGRDLLRGEVVAQPQEAHRVTVETVEAVSARNSATRSGRTGW
ncbi:hypothetical protein [Streptomyces sp. NPDC003710]